MIQLGQMEFLILVSGGLSILLSIVVVLVSITIIWGGALRSWNSCPRRGTASSWKCWGGLRETSVSGLVVALLGSLNWMLFPSLFCEFGVMAKWNWIPPRKGSVTIRVKLEEWDQDADQRRRRASTLSMPLPALLSSSNASWVQGS